MPGYKSSKAQLHSLQQLMPMYEIKIFYDLPETAHGYKTGFRKRTKEYSTNIILTEKLQT